MSKYGVINFDNSEKPVLVKYKKSLPEFEGIICLEIADIITNTSHNIDIGDTIILKRKDGDYIFRAPDDNAAKLIYEVGGYE